MTISKDKENNTDDTAFPLLQPEENLLTVLYRPADGQTCLENPPRFQWIPPQMGRRTYELEVQPLANDGAPSGAATRFTDIRFPFFTPERSLPSGGYRWRYRAANAGKDASDWSRCRRFELSSEAVEAPVTFDRRRATGPRPRLALAPDGHEDLAARFMEMPAWAAFMENSVSPWIDRAIPEEPAPYPHDQRTPELWRQSYITCQEALYGIRHLSIAGVLLCDEVLVARAREWLAAVAGWDPNGPTSRAYNDEAAFRVATALAWGYDWLRADLSPQETEAVRAVLRARGDQVARHIMQAARIDTFPYDSHAVRSISAVLVPVGLALAGEDATGTEWLDFAAAYLAGPYSAWADAEGGWAEGVHYWTTAMCYALEAVTLLRNATGLDIFRRPFFRNTGNFPLYCRPAWTRRGTFGDDSTLGNAPSLKIARNMRLLAAATGTPAFAGYADQVEALSDSDETAFYNYGWWDLNFDDLLREASFGAVKSSSMPAEPQVRVFPGVGWASLQARMDDPDRQIHCVFKSSPYGSLSHSHADQNAFCLSAFGEDILIQSGHYVAHNSSMHRNWRRQTISKNALLIEGRGQYAGDDMFLARKAAGRLVAHGGKGNHHWVVGDATEAYRALTSEIIHVRRHVHLVFGSAIVVVDFVNSDRPIPMTWLAHTQGRLTIEDISATIEGDHADTGIEVVYSTAAVEALRIVEGFDGVDAAEARGLPASRRLEIQVSASKDHVFATMITPVRHGSSPRVLSFVEDQGFGKKLYCFDGTANPVRLPLSEIR